MYNHSATDNIRQFVKIDRSFIIVEIATSTLHCYCHIQRVLMAMANMKTVLEWKGSEAPSTFHRNSMFVVSHKI